jgi:hypothetical protein
VTIPSKSYERVQYELRPAKQVERRMLIDALQILAQSGFQINDYKYTGMGSIYFVDFILFHKLLGIQNMLSVEYSNIKKRVVFNKPFDCINIEVPKPIGDIIPSLSLDLKHFLWLDYDNVLSRSVLDDVYLAASRLSVGSILLVTVDVEPPGEASDGPSDWRNYFKSEAGRYLGASLKVSDFAESKLPNINIQIIERAIKSGLTGRTDIGFFPLFNFLYADGNQMLTMGGMIVSNPERRQIRASRLNDAIYFRDSFEKEPFRIRIPKLTRKERLYLDSAMPCDPKWKPKEFELKKEDLSDYRDIYRFFPAYAELLL